jgi:hypothetical protein
MISTSDIYYSILLIVGIGISIKFLELLYLRKEFRSGHAYDWQIVGKDSLIYKRNTLLKKLYSEQGVILVIGIGLITLILAIFLFNNQQQIFHKVFLFIFIICNVIIYTRHSYGLDGADQMSLVILLTILLSYVITPSTNYHIGLYFISAQLSLSYIISGGAKLFSNQWRTGKAIQGILSTYTYGNRFTRKLFVGNNFISLIFCWFVILFELLFPLLLFCNADVLIIGLALGVLFHFMIALTMGLNDFLWSFSAAYPAFYFTSLQL